jgi:heme exporter protein D
MTWSAFTLAVLGLLLEALRSWRAIEPTLATVADRETRIRALEEK